MGVIFFWFSLIFLFLIFDFILFPSRCFSSFWSCFYFCFFSLRCWCFMIEKILFLLVCNYICALSGDIVFLIFLRFSEEGFLKAFSLRKRKRWISLKKLISSCVKIYTFKHSKSSLFSFLVFCFFFLVFLLNVFFFSYICFYLERSFFKERVEF